LSVVRYNLFHMHDAISLYLVEGFYETAQIFIILVGIAEKVFFIIFASKIHFVWLLLFSLQVFGGQRSAGAAE